MDAVRAAALLNEIAGAIEDERLDSAELRAAVKRVSIAFCPSLIVTRVVSITQPANGTYTDALSAELQRCVLGHVVEGHIRPTTAPARGILALSMAARRFVPGRCAPLEDACRAGCLRAPKTSIQQLWGRECDSRRTVDIHYSGFLEFLIPVSKSVITCRRTRSKWCTVAVP